jgi:hypothetical protein
MSRTVWTTVVGQPEGAGSGNAPEPGEVRIAASLPTGLVGFYGPLCSFLRRQIRSPWLHTPLPAYPMPEPPRGSAWVHEIKQDDYRLIARRDGNRVKPYTRRG